MMQHIILHAKFWLSLEYYIITIVYLHRWVKKQYLYQEYGDHFILVFYQDFGIQKEVRVLPVK